VRRATNERASSNGVLAVFDANVLVRALADRQPIAREWLARLDRREVEVAVPELVFAEVGQAFAGYVRAATMPRDAALNLIDFLRRLPLELRPLELLAVPALRFALERGVSVYDAYYGVLAEAERAVLVTADRRLAAAVERAEVVA
jgi:predicted nucleic acid-binding protein